MADLHPAPMVRYHARQSRACSVGAIMTREPAREYRCSFCGKRRQDVRRLIDGPGSAYICDECVVLCHEILEEEVPGFGHGSGKLRAAYTDLAEARATIEHQATELDALSERVRSVEAARW